MEVDTQQAVAPGFTLPQVVLPQAQAWLYGRFFKEAKKVRGAALPRTARFLALRRPNHSHLPSGSSSLSQNRSGCLDESDPSQQFQSVVAFHDSYNSFQDLSQDFSQDFSQACSRELSALSESFSSPAPTHTQDADADSAGAAAAAATEEREEEEEEESLRLHTLHFLNSGPRITTRINSVFPVSPPRFSGQEEAAAEDQAGEGETHEQAVNRRFLISSPGQGRTQLSPVEESPDCRLPRPTPGAGPRASNASDSLSPSPCQQGTGARFCLSPARLLALATNSPAGSKSFKSINIPFPASASPKKASTPAAGYRKTVVSHILTPAAAPPGSQDLATLTEARGPGEVEGQQQQQAPEVKELLLESAPSTTTARTQLQDTVQWQGFALKREREEERGQDGVRMFKESRYGSDSVEIAESHLPHARSEMVFGVVQSANGSTGAKSSSSKSGSLISNASSVMKVFRKTHSRSGSDVSEAAQSLITASNRSLASKFDRGPSNGDREGTESMIAGGSVDAISQLIENQVREQLYGRGGGSKAVVDGDTSSRFFSGRKLRTSSKVVSSSCMGLSSIKKIVKSHASGGTAKDGQGNEDRSSNIGSTRSRDSHVGHLSSRFSSVLLSVRRSNKSKSAEPRTVSKNEEGSAKQSLLRPGHGQSQDIDVRDVEDDASGRQFFSPASTTESQIFGSGELRGRDPSSRRSTGSCWKLESVGNFVYEDVLREENVKHSKRWASCDVETGNLESVRPPAQQLRRSNSLNHMKQKGEIQEDVYDWGKESRWDVSRSVVDEPVTKKVVHKKNFGPGADEVWACSGSPPISAGLASKSARFDDVRSGVFMPSADKHFLERAAEGGGLKSGSSDRTYRPRHVRSSSVFTPTSDFKASVTQQNEFEDVGAKGGPVSKLVQANNNVKDREGYDSTGYFSIVSGSAGGPPTVSLGCSAKSLARFIHDDSGSPNKSVGKVVPHVSSKQIAPECMPYHNGDLNQGTCLFPPNSSVDVSIQLASTEHIVSNKHHIRQGGSFHQGTMVAGQGRDSGVRRNVVICPTGPSKVEKPVPSSASATSEDSSLFTSFEVDTSAKKNFLSGYVLSGFRGKSGRPDLVDSLVSCRSHQCGNNNLSSDVAVIPPGPAQKPGNSCSDPLVAVNMSKLEDRSSKTSVVGSVGLTSVSDLQEKIIQESRGSVEKRPDEKSFLVEEFPVKVPVKLPFQLSPSLQERLEEYLSIQLPLTATGRELAKVLHLKTRTGKSPPEADAETAHFDATEFGSGTVTVGDEELSPVKHKSLNSLNEAAGGEDCKDTPYTESICKYANEELDSFLKTESKTTPQKFNILSNCSTDLEDLADLEDLVDVEQPLAEEQEEDIVHQMLEKTLKPIPGSTVMTAAADQGDVKCSNVVTSADQKPSPGRLITNGRCSPESSRSYSDCSSTATRSRARVSYDGMPAHRWRGGKSGAHLSHGMVNAKVPRSHRKGQASLDLEYYSTYLDKSSSESSTPARDSWQDESNAWALAEYNSSSQSIQKFRENSRLLKHASPQKKIVSSTVPRGRPRIRGAQVSALRCPAESRSQCGRRDKSLSQGGNTSLPKPSRQNPRKDKLMSEEMMDDQKLVDLPSSIQTLKVRESVSVVKNTLDPYQDFRTSMIAMIVEKDMREPGELEELLQAYLTLNAVEYHHLIVAVFTEVWHQLFDEF